jgi:ABC-type sugar transport system ATPase subunit/ribose/xylose/arabinose/galactoside ABC-type transport system permease subunit
VNPAEALLELHGIRKRYPGVVALNDVSFVARAGEVHALLGENGAGKSTLMGVASGAVAPDDGTIRIVGVEADALTPARATQLGLAIVHQEPALLPDLTVAENLALAAPTDVAPHGRPSPSWMREQLDRVGCSADVEQRVSSLTVAQRQLVELAKALALQPRVLILDEPTAALGADTVQRVFDQVRAAAARGAAVVYISHRLNEVRQIADRVTVMRDGAVRGDGAIDELSDDTILRLIVGRSLTTTFPDKAAELNGDAPALQLEGLTGSGFSDVSLTARRGEIVGLAGIAGNGQSEVLRALAGLERFAGTATINRVPLPSGSPRAARAAGVSYLAADRHSEGLLMGLSVRENAALAALPAFASRGVVDRRAEVAAVGVQREALKIRTPSLETDVASLSGGNQQKVALARTALADPSLVLADEPTQGVDAGARVEIYRILRQIADAGVPVVIVSSDGLELEGLCDRVVVLSRGEVVGELAGEQVTEEAIARAIVTATTHRREEARRQRAIALRRRRLVNFARGDYAPAAILAVVIVLLALYTNAENGRFLSAFNLTSLLTLMAALAFIAFGQLIVIMTGGIDLSVGPLAGLLVVIASFHIVDGKGTSGLLVGLGLMLAVATLTGLLNGVLVRYGRFTPVAATLALYIALQGVSLLLRNEQGGFIRSDVVDAVTKKVGSVPIALLVAIALAIVLELWLRLTKAGMALRAAGSREEAAHRLGIRVDRTFVSAYVASSLFTLLGGVMLMAQIGVGDPTQGVTYTLSSITAVVLGGASLFGGRGSFIGALLGAALIQEIINTTTFLNLSQAWQYWFVGLLTLGAAAIYTRAARARLAIT